MADSDDADDFVDSFDVLGTHFGWLDDHGPDHLDGVSRYPDFPNDMDWTGAFLDPLSEAIGRYVSVCSQLEIALFRVRSELDLDMTFAEAEWKRGPKGCLVDLREIAHTFPQAASDRLLALLHEASGPSRTPTRGARQRDRPRHKKAARCHPRGFQGPTGPSASATPCP